MTDHAVIGPPSISTVRFRKVLSTITSKWGPIVAAAEVRNRIPSGLLVALICHESGGNPNAHRYEPQVAAWSTILKMAGGDPAKQRFLATSWGLCQVMGYFSPVRTEQWITDPTNNVDLGAQILGRHLERYGGNVSDALAAYNGGVGAVNAQRKLGAYPQAVEHYIKSVESLRELAKKGAPP